MLSMRVRDVMRLPEPRWEAPRSADTAYGGSPGANRVLLFSGMDSGEKSTVVSAMEARGLPRLCVTSHSEQNTGMRLGEVLAEAVQADRMYWARISALREGKTPPPEVLDLADVEDAVIDEEVVPPPSSKQSSGSPSESPEQQATRDLWEQQMEEIHAEVKRRGEAGEDMSFMETPEAEEPQWMTDLLSKYPSLDQLFSGDQLDEMLAQRRDLMDGAEEDEELLRAGGADRRESGYATLEELMAAMTAAGHDAGGTGKTAPTVIGPELPPSMR